jgi:hypothetical protein
MNKSLTIQYDEPPPGLSGEQIVHWSEVRDALFRLHALGEKLPPVDAVAVVRAGRTEADQEEPE